MPYKATVPNFPSAFTVADLVLPDGLYYNGVDNTIEGTPTQYGTNFGLHAASIPVSGTIQEEGWSLTINRPFRTLLVISQRETNDRSTGEYYASQFMPFGSSLLYGGHAYEFRRRLNSQQPWPGVVQKNFVYGGFSRESIRETERIWSRL